MSGISILKNISNNIEKIIVGKREQIEFVLVALICKGHVLIEDVPGVGKTSLVSALSRSVSASFRRIQFTPDIMPSDITGFSIYNQRTNDFEYKKGSIMSQFILADEINRTSPKTQASLLEVMEENQVTVDGQTYLVPKPFMVLATQNPVDYLGTYPLPEAQLDRFFMKVSLGYPSFDEESKMLQRFQSRNPMAELEPVADSKQILQLQEEVENIYAEESIHRYIVSIVRKTREIEGVTLGASPRGSICLLKAAKGYALFSGRDYCIPEDVKKIAVNVLEHRIILKNEARQKRTGADIIRQVLAEVEAPL